MHPRMMPIITALACTNGDVGYGEPCLDFYGNDVWCSCVDTCYILVWIYLTWYRTKQVFVGYMMHLNAGVLLETFDNWFIPECWCEVLRTQILAPKEWLDLGYVGLCFGFHGVHIWHECKMSALRIVKPNLVSELWWTRIHNVFAYGDGAMHCGWEGDDMKLTCWGHYSNWGKVSSEKNRSAGEGRKSNHHADCDIQYQRIATSLGAATHLTLLPRFSWFGHHLLPGAHFTSLALI